jgi:hypothetical protein
MAHLKRHFVKVADEELLPVFVPTRIGALKPFGGTLKTMYDLFKGSRRLHYSRSARHYTKKDFRINGRRDYRPWRKSTVSEVLYQQ